MVHYIRYLKVPFFCSANNGLHRVVKALITITTDLGDDFFAKDLSLKAELFLSNQQEHSHYRHRAYWKGGSRVLWIEIDVPCFEQTQEHWKLAITTACQETDVQFDVLAEDVICEVFSAWSGIRHDAADAVNWNRVERRFMLRPGNVLSILEDTGESIARHIWDAGVALAVLLSSTIRRPTYESDTSYMLKLLQDRAASSSRNVLELGSGCGIVGTAVAQLYPSCNVLLTDLPEAMDILALNIGRSKPAEAATLTHSVLDWAKPIPTAIQRTPFDLVLVSDCTYNADSIPALVHLLSTVASTWPNVIIVVASKLRHPSEAIFFDLMADARFIQVYHKTVSLPHGGSTITGASLGIIDIHEFKRGQCPDE